LSLSNLNIAVTASRRAGELAQVIKSLGGRPYIAPTTGIMREESTILDVSRFIELAKESTPDFVVFMTGPSVYSLIDLCSELGEKEPLFDILRNTVLVARSPKTQMALFNFGLRPILIPNLDYTSTGVLQLFESMGVTAKKIAIIWHGTSSQHLVEGLERSGNSIVEVFVYKYSDTSDLNETSILERMGFRSYLTDETQVTNLVKDINLGNIDAITFTSPPSVRGLVNFAMKQKLWDTLQTSLNSITIVVAVGPSTAGELHKYGVVVDVIPRVFKMKPMIDALALYIQNNPINEKVKGLSHAANKI
jgi:uroporphyrinogen-III synthase